MRPAPRFAFLPDLQMPLRDALRGVASLAEVTEDVLEPAAAILPEPIRSSFRAARRAIEDAGKGLMSAPIGVEDIEAARAVLADGPAPADASGLATVLAYAWEHLHHSGLGPGHLVSETLLASQLTQPDGFSGDRPAARASALYETVRASSAIGPLPGVAGPSDDAAQHEVDAALAAIMVWLLTERAASMAEEERLLDLAASLVHAMQAEIAASRENEAAMAGFLETAAMHL